MLQIIMSIENEEDRSFVEELYIKYERHMYKIAYGVLHHHEDSEDCVHDTIQLIIDSLDKFKMADKREYLEKLLTIACRNCAINKYKKTKDKHCYEASAYQFNVEEKEFEYIEFEDPGSCVEDIVISEEKCQLLYELINKLDYKYRDVLVLKSLGYEHEDIAKIMSISSELARQRLRRARVKLIKMAGEALYA